jgi:hypothetical protein
MMIVGFFMAFWYVEEREKVSAPVRRAAGVPAK